MPLLNYAVCGARCQQHGNGRLPHVWDQIKTFEENLKADIADELPVGKSAAQEEALKRTGCRGEYVFDRDQQVSFFKRKASHMDEFRNRNFTQLHDFYYLRADNFCSANYYDPLIDFCAARPMRDSTGRMVNNAAHAPSSSCLKCTALPEPP